MCLPFRPINLTCIFLRLSFDRQEIFEGFAYRCVEEDEVFAGIMSIGSGAVGADGFSLKFMKIVLVS
jgi:hypothetical protein